MRPHCLSRGRLTGAAAAACAAALIPVASLAATGPASASQTACSTAGLVVWMNTQGSGYAGGVGYTLNFTNLSGHACTLRGYPGVSAVSLTGSQLGQPAGWGGPPPATVTLASGGTATATLLITDVGNYATGCNPVTAAGLRVYPPGQTAAKLIGFPFGACSGSGPVYLTSEPVHT